MNRKDLFDEVRKSIFGGLLSESQVSGIDAVLNEWEHRKLTDLRYLAYMLATDYHETAHTMQAIAEYGKGAGHSYGQVKPETGRAYYGRGLVQLTWDYNYKKMGDILDLDLYRNPDLALKLSVAVQIMFEGMLRGSFTTKKLADYFTPTKTDWYNARRIINGTDRAELIAGYGKTFHAALVKAISASVAVIEPPSIPPDIEAIPPKPKRDDPVVPIGSTGGAVAAAAWWQGVPFVWIVLIVIVTVAVIVILKRRRN